MGNGRKQTALWLVFVEGAALSLGIYLLLTVLLSALVVKAVLPGGGELSRCGGVVLSGVLRRGHAQCPPLLLGQPGQRHGERRGFSAGGGGCGSAVLAADHLAGPRGVLLLCGAGGGLLAGVGWPAEEGGSAVPVRRGRKA